LLKQALNSSIAMRNPVMVLPSHPKEYQVLHPSMYEAFYKDSVPTDCQVEAEISAVAITIRLRQAKDSSRSPMLPAGLSLAHGDPLQALLRLAACIQRPNGQHFGRQDSLENIPGFQLLSPSPQQQTSSPERLALANVVQQTPERLALASVVNFEPKDVKAEVSTPYDVGLAMREALAIRAAKKQLIKRPAAALKKKAVVELEDEDEDEEEEEEEKESEDDDEESEAPKKGKGGAAAKLNGKAAEKAKDKAAAKAKGKAAAKPTAKAAGKLPKAAAKPKKPSWSDEMTRNQIMCRTGCKGAGSTMAIKYGKHAGIDFGSKKDAIRRAKKFLKGA